MHQTPTPPRVLVADDQADILQALRLLLADAGFEPELVNSVDGIRDRLAHATYDLLLMDLNYTRDTTSGQEGFELLERMRAIDSTLPVLVITGWGSVSGAVEAMRRGARDYIEKPWDDDKLLASVATQLELRRALRKSRRLQEENTRRQSRGLPDFITEAPSMKDVRESMQRVAPSDASVLITGEHGTGKEMAARWVHAASARAGRPLVVVDMGGLAEGVFESELFGHVKGAFTDAKADRVGRFELADGGTLFLDEIGNMSAPQQAKLLRVLQTGEVERVGSSRTRRLDVRVIAATNADLRADVASGRFREDLLYRLNTVEVHLPPLRERRDDIAPLAAWFLQRHAARYRKPLSGFEPAAMQALLAHSWPGNVRELSHAIERAVLMAQRDQVRAVDLALSGRQGDGGAGATLEDMPLEEVERVLIKKALDRAQGNVSHAARALGLSRSALYRRMAHFGL